MTDRSKEASRRLFRRLRAKFKADLGLDSLSGSDRVLLDQAALLALRARQMRDAVLGGEEAVDDETIVRCANAAMRAMTLLRNRKDRDKAAHVPFWQQAPIEDDDATT
jgi:hypothetical protein